ncbi:MAG: hypothetical protein AUI14_18600 [Actinobacteria bacterium 13_2_20CM_2_71_6]|nr:MAG: hypothetical protein AUI14_18600 [Actinobacteria bacterium 13_2_20CM_2_71_6]
MLSCQATGGNQMVVRLLESARSAALPGDDLAGQIRTRLGGGQPLPASVRTDVETGLGQRLGDVRLHTDAPAATFASELNAHAFTTGNDIFFNAGVYDPATTNGYATLAHELTHTLQQASGPVDARQLSADLHVSSPHDGDERQARSTAEKLTAQRHTDQPQPDSFKPAPSGGDGMRALAVQRHSSWEHTMLGDTPPAQLGAATVTAQARKHLLADLWARMMFFSADPGGDPRGRFPNVRWIQLRGSGLWVSNGEVNALADYLPDAAAADTMTREQLAPVLQKMRSGIRGAAGAEFGLHGTEMAGMATHWMEFLSEAGGEVKALDEATAGQGSNRYAGLLTRNACHFAPFSWHRWEQYHNEAADEARLHFASRTSTAPLRDVPREAEEHARQAILKNGYGDHFLEDSFAAGHLVNKTLVMQWWVDYLNGMDVNIPGTDIHLVRRGQPDPDVMRRMGSTAQTGIAGQDLYDRPPTEGTTNRGDRFSGTAATDPQSAQERTDRDRRVSGSGVSGADSADREANYQALLRLLNNAQAQGAAGATHDYFNRIGLTVVSADGSTRMRVGGDDTLISQSSAVGAAAAAQAATLSRQAIEDILNTGTTAISVETIFALVPTQVVVDGVPEPMPLEQWQDQVLHNLCLNTIFPEYYRTLKSAIIGAFGSEMVDGGMSQDSGRAPAISLGDFELELASGRYA